MKTEIPIWVLMKITEKEIERRLNDKAVELGLTSAQMQVLHFICRKSGEICQKDMESRFDLTHATVSGIVDRLEAKGFIETKADARDKRRKVIFATPKAHACNEATHGYIINSDRQMMHGFTEEEQKQMRDFLTRILNNVKTGPLTCECACEPEEPKGGEDTLC